MIESEKMYKNLKALKGKVIMDAHASVFSGGSIGAYELNFDDGAVCKVTWGHSGLDVYDCPIFESHHDWGSFTREPFDFLLVGQAVEAIHVEQNADGWFWYDIYVVGTTDVVRFELVLNAHCPDGIRLVAPSAVPEHLIQSNARGD